MQKYNILNDLGNNRNEMLVRLASCAGVVWAFYLSYFDVALALWKTFLFFFLAAEPLAVSNRYLCV